MIFAILNLIILIRNVKLLKIKTKNIINSVLNVQNARNNFQLNSFRFLKMSFFVKNAFKNKLKENVIYVKRI